MAEYSQIMDPLLQTRVRNRYQTEITSLQALGFRHLAYCLEALGPYSVIFQFPLIPLALLKKEVLHFLRPLRLASANVLLSNTNPPTVALCMGMGIKFYSAFTDGALLISSNFDSKAMPWKGSKVIRLPSRSTIEDTWTEHKARALRMAIEVSPIFVNMSFDDYIKMSTQEDEELSQFV